MAKIKLVQFKSANGANRPQRETLRSLGLGRIGARSEHEDSPQIRGMANAVDHLVKVDQADG